MELHVTNHYYVFPEGSKCELVKSLVLKKKKKTEEFSAIEPDHTLIRMLKL